MSGKTGITLTVDLVVVVEGHLVLERRAYPPFMDRLVLPGGHVDLTDQSLAHAASRELLEETGLKVSPYDLRLLTVLDDPDRDPRGRYVSVVFYAELATAVDRLRTRAASDAREIVIRPLHEIRPDDMGFDHYLAVAAYIGRKADGAG